MDFKDVEKAMYNDEEFLKYLPLLQKEYWKKAPPGKRIKIFDELQRIIHSLDETFPVDVEIFEKQPNDDQNIIIATDAVLIEEDLLNKTINPYLLIELYIFEIELINNWNRVEDEEFIKTEEGKRIAINGAESITGDWDNYFPRKHTEFFIQPVTWESTKVAKNFTYNLMKYMHKKYGMDDYIGAALSDLMIGSFKISKMEERVEQNYKEMEERVTNSKDDPEKLNQYFNYMNSLDYENISDDEFFSLFNKKLMERYNEETLCFLMAVFIKRELKGCEDLNLLLKEVAIGECEDDKKFLFIGGQPIIGEDYQEVFTGLVTFVSTLKLLDNLCTEISDKQFLDEARQCYEYMNELSDEKGELYLPYSENATSYNEYKMLMIEHYYNKMKKGIESGKYYNKGIPFMNYAIPSKCEAYLSFAFDKSFDEIKKIQLDSFEEQYKKIGGRR